MRGSMPRAVLGPAAARLSMTFASVEAHRDFWRAHPAMGAIWGPGVEAYVDYDLTGVAPELRSSCREEAMRVDGAEVADQGAAAATLSRVTAPISFLRAERGLDDGGPLYREDAVARWLGTTPVVRSVTIPDTNHYSLLMGGLGAERVVEVVREVLASG